MRHTPYKVGQPGGEGYCNVDPYGPKSAKYLVISDEFGDMWTSALSILP